jgi:transaldolase
MKIFLDSANLDEIKKAAELGICDGVTTNPTLIAKSGQDFKWVIAEICKLIPGPISAEVVSSEFQEMLKEAQELIKIHENIVIKLPLTQEGLKACKALSSQRIKTNVTLCFQPAQALLAAKCGATYISPFIGRLDDQNVDGLKLIKDIATIYKNYEFQTKILAASIRTSKHVVEAALVGAHVVTCPFKVIETLYEHTLTTQGLNLFAADWKTSGQKPIV